MNPNWEYKILNFFPPAIAKRDGNLITLIWNKFLMNMEKKAGK